MTNSYSHITSIWRYFLRKFETGSLKSTGSILTFDLIRGIYPKSCSKFPTQVCPPIKVTHRKIYKESMLGSSGRTQTSFSLDQIHFSQRQTCVGNFEQLFGYMPLIRSKVRMDPVLYILTVLWLVHYLCVNTTQ
jgi:hypothetical protein